MASRNTRNARLQLSTTVGGSYTSVNKTHGLKVAVPTDFSEDTGHGQKFKTNTPGLQDYKIDIMKWYDDASSDLEDYSVNKTKVYFRYYPDLNNPLDYDTGACYIGWNEQNSDLGNTTDQAYTLVLADGDPTIVRNGTAL